MKSENEYQPKYESIRRSAAGSGRLKRVGICVCGRPTAVVQGGHRWQRLAYCGHCGPEATAEATHGPNATNIKQAARRAV